MLPPDGRQPRELLPGEMLDGYQIRHFIGAGGEAFLHAARDTRTRKRVALKFPERATEANIERLWHEVSMGIVMNHPNICKSEKVGAGKGFTFGVMQYVEGDNLKLILHGLAGRPLKREKALRVAAQLCAGVSYMHKAGIVHRDLKPANIMIDAEGQVKIIDLSVAGFETDNVDPMVGTLEYMAPERIAGGVSNRAADVFAIGVILYEIFTGSRWLQTTLGTNPSTDVLKVQMASVYVQAKALPPRPSTINTDLGAKIDDLIMPCLSFEPSARHPADFLRDEWAEVARL